MSRYVFFYPRLILGGAEWLIVKLSKYLKGKGHECEVWAFACDAEIAEICQDAGVELRLLSSDAELARRANSAGDRGESLRLVVFFARDLLHLTRATVHCPDGSVLLYIVHPSVLTLRGRGLKRLYRFPFRRAANACFAAGQIVFMDEVCKEASASFCGNADMGSSGRVVRLAVEEGPPLSFRERSGECGIRVLTVARAEFPFKAYMFGLISSVIALNDEGYNIDLEVVSYGEGLSELVGHARKNKHVSFLGRRSHDELWGLYDSCDLYVGMGTTTIEAASRGKAVLVAKNGRREFVTPGFFGDMPTYVGGDYDGGYKNGLDVLRDFARMDASEREAIARRCRDGYLSNYSLSATVDALEEAFASCTHAKGVSIAMADFANMLLHPRRGA